MILLVEESQGDVDAKGDISSNLVVHDTGHDKEPLVVSSKHFHLSRATILGLHHDALSESHALSSQNILQPQVASFLYLDVESIPLFDVFVGNKEKSNVLGAVIASLFTLLVPNFTFCSLFYLFMVLTSY